MKQLKVHVIMTLFFSSILFFLSASYVFALSIEFTANNAGLTLKYDLKRLGSDEVTLAPGSPEQELSLTGIAGQLVRLRIRVDSVAADSPIPVVNTFIKAFVTGMPSYEFPLPLPFGDYGIEAGLFSRTAFQDRNAPLEISLLCALLKTDYDITLNLDQLFNETWQGSATLNNNVIKEEIALSGDTAPVKGRVDLTIIPVKTIPLTFFVFSADVYDGNNSLIQPISGVIPIPNGSYHLWLNPGFDFTNIFSLQAQACCVAEAQTCEDALSILCQQAGGVPQGTGTTCATVDCGFTAAGY
jgi:hypothetical protein